MPNTDPREYFNDETLALMNRTVGGLVSNINTSNFTPVDSSSDGDLLELQHSDIENMSFETLNSRISECHKEIGYANEVIRSTNLEGVLSHRRNKIKKIEGILKMLGDARSKTPEAIAEREAHDKDRDAWLVAKEKERIAAEKVEALLKRRGHIAVPLILCVTGVYLYFLWITGIPRAVWFSYATNVNTPIHLVPRDRAIQAMLFDRASTLFGLYGSTWTGLVLPLGGFALVLSFICMYCQRVYVCRLSLYIIGGMYLVQLAATLMWESQYRPTGGSFVDGTLSNILLAVFTYAIVLLPGFFLSFGVKKG